MRHSMIEILTPESRRKKKIVRWVVVGILILLLTPAAIAIYYYESNDTVRTTWQTWRAGNLPVDKAFPGRDSITLLMLGRDIDINRYKQVLKTRGRSDTIILVKINFITREMRLLSIPRDTAVKIPGYRGIYKINAAHAFGGPELTAQTIQNLIGVPIDYYVVVNYRILEKSIDRLGGLTVYVDKDLDYDDNWGDLHIHLKKGNQHLNGKEAIGFVRFRHSNFRGKSDSDLTRMQRQQRLLQALMRHISNPVVLPKVPGVVDEVRRDLVTNLTTAQIVSLAFFARSVPRDKVTMQSLPSREGPVFVYMDRDETRTLVADIFGILPEEFPSTAALSYDDVRRSAERVLRHRQELSAAGKPGAEEWEEPPVPEESVTQPDVETPSDTDQPDTPATGVSGAETPSTNQQVPSQQEQTGTGSGTANPSGTEKPAINPTPQPDISAKPSAIPGGTNVTQ